MSFISRSICPILFLLLLALGGCKKYLDVPLPVNVIASESVFGNDQTCAAALNSVYFNLVNQGYFAGTTSTTFDLGLYGDEMTNYGVNINFKALYVDAVGPTAGGVTTFWTSFYSQLYGVNQAIQGIQANNALTYKSQWLGEAYFLRGLLYFYLTSLYGDVPIVLTPDYLTNNSLARNAQADVYKQIIADLKLAQSLLNDQYHDDDGAVTTDRGRPNRMAATALLARTYLYTKDWTDAEVQADSVIADNTDYQLPALNTVFQMKSPEIIWGLTPTGSLLYPYQVTDALIFSPAQGTQPGATSGYAVTMSDSLKNAFEPGDLRYTNWVYIDTVPASGSTPQAIYYFPHKYQAKGTFSAPQESIVMFRLAEQYLIRAEARAQLNELSGSSGAIGDLNTVRTRAGLTPATATTQTDVLNAVQKERRVELFCEEGHRFLDLRRTGTLDALMTILVPLKGGAAWVSTMAYWPIPVTDIQNDPSLKQTPGY